ncbi:MAG TPA: DUF3592 domain-containing protein [Terracidiphilus sp.]|jgi:hypothetical protein
MFSSVVLVVLFILGALAALAIWLVWQNARREKTESWPETEATIQSVGKVIGSGRGSYPLDVGDFSYVVNGEYYSGRATISRSFSTGDVQPGDLVDKKFQVRYNPLKPDKYDVSQADVGGFLLDPYDDFLMHDIGDN